MDDLDLNKVISSASVVVTEPFLDKGTEISTQGGFAKITQKHGLTELRVVFGNNLYCRETFVYVRSEAFRQNWANEKFKLMDGTQEVIAVPVDQILLSSPFSIK